MGGKAFPTNQRLSTPELTALTSHCLSHLSSLSPPPFSQIQPLRHLTSKTSHGDLDLVLSWDHAPLHDTIKGKDDSDSSPFPGSPDDVLAQLAWMISRAEGASRWFRLGGEIVVAVPTYPGSETTYQVDHLLRHPTTSPLSHFLLSYGPIRAILAHLINLLSPQLILHDHLLELKYTSHPGCGKLRVPLTSDPAALCEWLGLGYTQWVNGVFDVEEDLWRWLGDCAAGSLMEGALRGMREGKRTKGLRDPGVKGEGVGRFVAWLGANERFGKGADQCSNGEEKDKNALERGAEPGGGGGGTMDGVGVGGRIDPNKPIPLDDIAWEAVRHWGKEDAYARALEERRAEALEMVKNQGQKKKKNRGGRSNRRGGSDETEE